ncbi:MAG: transglycosylase domain-containing protein [Halobacteriovoraceae bacterium]|nr:transglycosylase domain-containing protein [Halobacteriovoraceae bacterium]
MFRAILVISLFIGCLPIYLEIDNVFSLSKLDKGFITYTLDKDAQAKYHFTKTQPKSWVSLNEISPNAYYAIQINEDWNFFEHHGVDLTQVGSALYDYFQGAKLRGASTISQQFIKNYLLTSKRNILRKIREFYLTLIMEQNLSKERILELYLNTIEYGPGLYGILNASKFYFKKLPKDLLPEEGAFLALILPNPAVFSRSFYEKKISQGAKKEIQNVLHKMAIMKYITKQEKFLASTRQLSFEDQEDADHITESLSSPVRGTTKAQEIEFYNNDDDYIVETIDD